MQSEGRKYDDLDKPALISLLLEHQREIEKLQNHIRNANKKEYGVKSEKLSINQTRFDFTKEFPPEQLPLKEVVVPEHKRTVRKGRKPLPDDLPREEIVYEVEATTCSCCGSDLVVIGEERSEELEKIPAQLKVIEHIRIKKACTHCKEAGVLTPPLPPSVFPLERARPGAGLLADIIVSKYVDHLPLHRQEEMYSRRGIVLPRQRMCDWVGGVVDLLSPLYSALRQEVLSHPYVQADETTLKVQDGEVEGKCHTGYLWGVLAPPKLVYFHYAKTRAGEVPKEIFKGYEGAVQTDAYAGYNKIFLPDKCVRVACLAHVRRKFIEVQESASKECARVLTIIAALYRTRNAKNVDELFRYLRELSVRTLPKSLLFGALQYALNQEEEIRRIFSNDLYQLDNNAIERQMKHIAIGRKNYLFAGSHDGARRAAVLYSFLSTCKLNHINPWEWLSDVLRRIASDRSVTASDLLPHNWRKTG